MTSPSKQQTINIYGPGEFGPRQLVAIVHGVETIESEPQHPKDAYCKVFRTRFFFSATQWTTIWSDNLSWEVYA